MLNPSTLTSAKPERCRIDQASLVVVVAELITGIGIASDAAAFGLIGFIAFLAWALWILAVSWTLYQQAPVADA